MVVATGPYRGDERGRYHYRSNPKAAQKMIERQSRDGLLYLGEWHTHAEDFPSASTSDLDAMNKLLWRSKLNVSEMLMLIVGQSNEIEGYKLSSISNTDLNDWKLTYDGS